MQSDTLAWLIPALLSALFAALTTILSKIGVAQIDSNVATAIRTTIVLLITWGIVAAQGNLQQAIQIPQKTLIFLIFSGIATGLSWLFYFRALQLGHTGPVVAIDKSSLVFVILLAGLFLREPLTIKTALGSLLIVAGTLVIVL
ncbi:MAG: EamA family transporter [Plectolyngbya sp. WJT66-NPBG17]|jgi:transporter family protein|nr:EamA family transporter [Plectolyngbya sp. WJT66-NPBG17]